MTVKQIDHLNLTVHNLATSIDWYGKLFGYTVVERGHSDHYGPWAILRSGEAMLCIYELPGLGRVDQFAFDEHILRVQHIGFRITDRAAWEKVVEEHDVHVHHGGAHDWPHSVSWYITDPDGYQIEVVLWKDDQIRFAPQAA